MTPVYQQEQHDLAKGIWGDCHRAALASLLDLPINDVPHFCDGGPPDWPERERAWLAGRGMLFLLGVVPVVSQSDALRYASLINPQPSQHFILSGASSADGLNHSVVCRGERVVHDPDPEALTGQPALNGPLSDVRQYVARFLVPLPPAMRPPLQPAAPGFRSMLGGAA